MDHYEEFDERPGADEFSATGGFDTSEEHDPDDIDGDMRRNPLAYDPYCEVGLVE